MQASCKLFNLETDIMTDGYLHLGAFMHMKCQGVISAHRSWGIKFPKAIPKCKLISSSFIFLYTALWQKPDLFCLIESRSILSKKLLPPGWQAAEKRTEKNKRQPQKSCFAIPLVNVAKYAEVLLRGMKSWNSFCRCVGFQWSPTTFYVHK